MCEQAACVEVQYLHADGTLDDGMWVSLQKKQSAMGQALEGNVAGSAMGASPKPCTQIYTALRS